MTNSIKFSTATGRPVSVITLFIQFKNGAKKTLRGDKFTEIPKEMIANLFRHACKIARITSTIVMYDNRKPNSGQENIVLKWTDGQIIINNTKEYDIVDIVSYSF